MGIWRTKDNPPKLKSQLEMLADRLSNLSGLSTGQTLRVAELYELHDIMVWRGNSWEPYHLAFLHPHTIKEIYRNDLRDSRK